MRSAAEYRRALSTAPPAARPRLAKLYRTAAARERVQKSELASDTLWSSRGDLEAVAGVRSHPFRPMNGWDRFRRDGRILIDSSVLGERVVVVADESTPVPPEYADLSVWTLAELRRVRDALRGGQFRFEVFESINRVKRQLGGVVLSASSPVLRGEVTGMSNPGSPLQGFCSSPTRAKRCTSRIAAGEPTALLTPDTSDGSPGEPVEICMPCAVRFPWTDAAIESRKRWAKSEGVRL